MIFFSPLVTVNVANVLCQIRLEFFFGWGGVRFRKVGELLTSVVATQRYGIYICINHTVPGFVTLIYLHLATCPILTYIYLS